MVEKTVHVPLHAAHDEHVVHQVAHEHAPYQYDPHAVPQCAVANHLAYNLTACLDDADYQTLAAFVSGAGTSDAPHTYTFTGPCRVTGRDHSVTMAGANLFRFRQTDDITDLGLDADWREFVITGTSPEGWQQLFGSDEE